MFQKNKAIFIIFAFMFIFIMFSCKHSKNKHILQKSEMISLLTEIKLAEATIINSKLIDNDSVAVFSNYIFDSIFNKYGINKATYDENLEFYQNNINDFIAINDSVLLRLKLLKQIMLKDSLLNDK